MEVKKIKARISVRLKPVILDPQGKTVLRAAKQMGYDEISSVRIGKLIELEIETNDKAKAEKKVEEISHRLLTNPLMETYEVEWDGDEN